MLNLPFPGRVPSVLGCLVDAFSQSQAVLGILGISWHGRGTRTFNIQFAFEVIQSHWQFPRLSSQISLRASQHRLGTDGRCLILVSEFPDPDQESCGYSMSTELS